MAQSVILRALLRRNLSSSGLLLPLSTLLSKTPPPPTPIKPSSNSDTLPSLLNNPYPVIIPSTFFSSSSHQPNLDQEPKKKKNKKKNKPPKKSGIDFTKIDSALLPTVIIVGRPNVGKSALFNRLIGRREALVYNTPDDHVTRDIREGIAKLGDLRFRVLDSAGLETEATSGTILSRTTEMTARVLARAQFAIFLIDVRDGLQPLDRDVGKWMRKHASGIRTIVAMNKSESLDERGLLGAEAGEAYGLGFGDPIAISAETGLGMVELYETLQPLLEGYVHQLPKEQQQDDMTLETEENGESKLPLQLAIVGRPNVGKSTLLNTLLQEERVLVGPEAGLTRDSIRTQFQFEGRTIYLVDTAGWLQRAGQEKGPGSLSIVQSRKSLMRAHVIALVLDGEEIAKSKRSMKHAEVVIARQAIEEGRGLVVIVNKMDLLRGKQNSALYDRVIEAVPKEVQSVNPQIAKSKRSMKHAEVVIARQAIEEGRGLVVIVNKMDLLRGQQNSALYDRVIEAVPKEVQSVNPQVTGIPVVFISAMEGKGRMAVMHQVTDTYEKWCLRLSTSRLNRWLRKVMSRHSWKDLATQPRIKYFTQVKARPPTFVAFLSGKAHLSDADTRFLTKSLTEDFDLGGIPIRIMQRSVPRKAAASNRSNNLPSCKVSKRARSDKRTRTSERAST